MTTEVSNTSISPSERLMRKRQAARLRQQRCRARKKELSVAAKKQGGEGKSAAQIPAAPTRRPVVLPSQNRSAPAAMNRPLPPSTGHPSQQAASQQPNVSHLCKPHQPHRPHQPHQPHQPHRPHHLLHQAHRRPHMHHQVPRHPRLHVPPPPGRSRHHHVPHPHPHHIHPSQQPRYHVAIHRPLFRANSNEASTGEQQQQQQQQQQPHVATRMQSIGSVVSFDDGSYPVPFYLKHQPRMVSTASLSGASYVSNKTGDLAAPTVSPTEVSSSKAVVEPDATAIKALSVPPQSPSKEETAIHAMLALSTSFGA